MKTDRWIQEAHNPRKKGALHRQLGLKPGHKLSKMELREIKNATLGTKVRGHRITGLLKKRAVFALNAQKRRR